LGVNDILDLCSFQAEDIVKALFDKDFGILAFSITKVAVKVKMMVNIP